MFSNRFKNSPYAFNMLTYDKHYLLEYLMKKIILSAAALLLGTAIHAESCATSVQGFYAGVNAGLQHSAGRLTTNFTSSNIQKSSIGKNTFLGGLFVGYQMGVGSCAIVGGEVFGNFTNYSETAFDNTGIAGILSFKESLQNKLNWGAKVRLGYTMSQRSVLFLGLGLEYNSLKLKSERVDKQIPALAQPGESIVKKTKKGISFAPSVGVDLFANDKLFVRAEYTYVFPVSLKVEHRYNNGANNTATFRAKLNNSRFTLGLGYKF